MQFTPHDLENPELLHINRLPPRATVVPAQKTGVYYRNKDESILLQCLNGEYRFCYEQTDCISNFYDEDYDDTAWDMLAVPSMWQYHGYGNVKYTNIDYPFPFNPPYVGNENPVGYYRRTFTLQKRTARTILYFGGVNSAFCVYCNGTFIGFSKGSRLPAEFDVTSVVRDGNNTLAIKVFTYCDGSYLENQDMLLASGIFRDVTLHHVNDVSVWDYELASDLAAIYVDLALTYHGERGYRVAITVDGEKRILDASEKLSAIFNINEPKLWNAEIPHLYDVTVELQKDGMTVETHSKRVGLTTSGVRGNHVLVNERPVLIKGINRHEHDPKNGQAITVFMIEQELRLIKDHNMNAIRCAHYPNHPAFYEIASELGLYVMNECDLETHGCSVTGDQGYLSKDPLWLDAYVDRIQRMVARDKNDTCVFMWSLGNETGCGPNLDKCADWLKALPHRKIVIHVQDDSRNPKNCDVRSNGYCNMESLMSFEEEGEPVLLIEYAHAMGNSPGLLEDYWDCIYTHPHMCGGFAWEFKNHGFFREDPEGNPYYQYGGDFGDINHWANFSMDGFCISDGTPKPSLLEYKEVLSPAYATLSDGKLKITNTNAFRALDYLEMRWEILEDYNILRQGEMRLPPLAPHEMFMPDLDLSVAAPKSGATYRLDLHFFEGEKNISNKQFTLPIHAKKELFSPAAFEPAIEERDRCISIHDRDVSLTFESGLLSRFVKDGQVLIDAPMKLNFYRAPIDNDGIVGWSLRRIAEWDSIFLRHFEYHCEGMSCKQEHDAVHVKAVGKALPTGRFAGFYIEMNYRIYHGGFILIEITGRPYGNMAEVLPRIGVVFPMEKSFRDVSWWGRGPGENYCDRKASAPFGLYRDRVEKMNFMYDVPQENGTRFENSFATLSDDKNSGVTVIGSDTFGFSYHDYSLEDLINARHRNELKKSEKNYLYIDYKMRGLGSFSCGPEPEERYELRPHDFRFTFGLAPAMADAAALALSRQQFCSTTQALGDAYVKPKTIKFEQNLDCDLD